MKPEPRISVVIATYNRCALLARTLPTVINQTLDPELYEIVVVSDGSTDGTMQLLRSISARCTLRVFEQCPNQGQAKAANRGAREARGKYVLFLDDDIVCDSALLQIHLEFHENRGLDALAFGPVWVSDESPNTLATDWTRAYTAVYTQRLADSIDPVWPCDANVDANASMPREVFLQSGGFDESFLSARQNEELGSRLWRGGLRFVYLPNASVHQIFVKSNRAVALADGAAYGKAEIHMMRKLPYTRSTSSLADLLHASFPKRLLHRVVTTMPFSPEPLLRPACMVVHALRSVSSFGRLGPRILNWRRSIAFHRAAIHEVGGLRAAKAEFGTVLPVLMYHHIGPPVPGTFPELTVSPKEFERHLRLLQRRAYTAITAEDWLAYVREGKPLRGKPMLLTFDDAYEDMAQYVFPLLEKYGMTGLVFVPTAYIGDTNLWDQANGSAPHRMLFAEQIAEWAARGIEFGAHTHTHPCLQRVALETMSDELSRSKQELESIIGKPVTTFAYPYGEYGDREAQLALDYFPICFTTDEGTNDLTTDLGRLRRIMVYPDGLLMFRLSLALGFQPIRWLRERLRLRTRLRRQWNYLLGRTDTSRFGADRPYVKCSPESVPVSDSSSGHSDRL